ncbi:TPA: DUF4406 domain-containing protein [Pseudomonas aeruginosa]
MHRVYLSGPMTGITDFNYPAFNAEEKRIRALGITGMKEAISQLPGIFRRKENLLPNHWNINSVDRLKPNFKPTPIALPIFGLWRLKRSANIRKHKRK